MKCKSGVGTGKLVQASKVDLWKDETATCDMRNDIGQSSP